MKGAINKGINDAYRAKYKESPYLSPMIGAGARAATVKVTPARRIGAGADRTQSCLTRGTWHTHPLGQTLIVLCRRGLVQREAGPIEETRPGDIVRFAPNEKHWHGASPETAMQHIAVQEALDGEAVDWLEHVTDEQYTGKRAAR